MPSEIDQQLKKKPPCKHIPMYDAAVNETYCELCLERLPNVKPIVTSVTSFKLVLLIYFVLGATLGIIFWEWFVR